MANLDAVTKVLSQSELEAIAKIAKASPSSDVFEHINQKFSEARIDNTYFKNLNEAYKSYDEDLDNNVFQGIRTSIDPELSDLALLHEAKNRQLKESLSCVNFDIRYVEENKDIGQERQIPVAFYLGNEQLSIDAYAKAHDESPESCHVKVLGTWSDTWLRELGLDYDYEKSTIIDKKTGKVPSKEEFENKIKNSGDETLNRFTEKAKKNGLLQKNGEIIGTYAALDFNNRQRATPVLS